MTNIEQLLEMHRKTIDFTAQHIKTKLNGKLLTLYFEQVVFFLFRKINKSFNAIFLLCENGYGQDALIITRSIFEAWVNLLYMSQDSEIRAKLFQRHYLITNKLRIEKLIGRGIQTKEDLEEFENNHKADYLEAKILLEQEARKTKPKGPKYSWSGLTTKDMIIAVGLETSYHTEVYELMSDITHTNSNSILSYSSESSFNQSLDETVQQALIFSFDVYLEIIKKVNEIFKLGIEKEIKIFEDQYPELN